MSSPVIHFLTGSADGDRAFGLLVFGIFTLAGIIAVLLAIGTEALWGRWRFDASRRNPVARLGGPRHRVVRGQPAAGGRSNVRPSGSGACS